MAMKINLDTKHCPEHENFDPVCKWCQIITKTPDNQTPDNQTPEQIAQEILTLRDSGYGVDEVAKLLRKWIEKDDV